MKPVNLLVALGVPLLRGLYGAAAAVLELLQGLLRLGGIVLLEFLKDGPGLGIQLPHLFLLRYLLLSLAAQIIDGILKLPAHLG